MKVSVSRHIADRLAVTRLILNGSLVVAATLTSLLLIYDLSQGATLRPRFWIACLVISYLFTAHFALTKGHIKTAGWLLIILYELLAFAMLLTWGLSSSVGILTASFAVLLPGIMLSPKAILPVGIFTFINLSAVYLAHATNLVDPNHYLPPENPNPLDVVSYATILSIFALVSWISTRQTTQSLSRALDAEKRLERQKAELTSNLAFESAELRRVQRDKTEELYKFALIGQSTAATLHELANQLSVLNLDIDDIKEKHRTSKALKNAENSIRRINKMVSDARTQLKPADPGAFFNLDKSLSGIIKDFESRLKSSGVTVHYKLARDTQKIEVSGSEQGFIQSVIVLVNNSLHALRSTAKPHITISVERSGMTASITVADNGPGIAESKRRQLFQLHDSDKSTGMGAGLYIAQQIIESQLNGTLEHIDVEKGASFKITIPVKP